MSRALQRINAEKAGVVMDENAPSPPREMVPISDAAEHRAWLEEEEKQAVAAAGSVADTPVPLDAPCALDTRSVVGHIPKDQEALIAQAVAMDGRDLSDFDLTHHGLLVWYADTHIGRGARQKWTFEDLVLEIRAWCWRHPLPEVPVHLRSYGARRHACMRVMARRCRMFQRDV